MTMAALANKATEADTQEIPSPIDGDGGRNKLGELERGFDAAELCEVERVEEVYRYVGSPQSLPARSPLTRGIKLTRALP
jgi:hypothetical protein